jgi:hypothetical protein
MDWSSDRTATYAELSTFNDTLTTEWVPVDNFVTVSSGHESYYANGQRTLNQYTVPNTKSIQKTFATPVDISRFTEIAFWILSQVYQGAFIQLGIGKNAPNEYTHNVLVPFAYEWCQDTWDIRSIPQQTLAAIKYLTLTINMPQQAVYPIQLVFDELVARNVTMLDSVYRALRYKLDGTLTDPTGHPVTATVRTPEFYKRETPGYLIHLDPPEFDNRIIGRVAEDKSRHEYELINGIPFWKIAGKRTAFIVRVQIDVYSKYEQFDLSMTEFLLQTIPARGALAVAGDLIDFLLISSVSLDEGNDEQRVKRKMFEYELWTWDYPEHFISYANLTTDITYGELPSNVGPGPGKRPDVYINELQS